MYVKLLLHMKEVCSSPKWGRQKGIRHVTAEGELNKILMEILKEQLRPSHSSS